MISGLSVSSATFFSVWVGGTGIQARNTYGLEHAAPEVRRAGADAIGKGLGAPGVPEKPPRPRNLQNRWKTTDE